MPPSRRRALHLGVVALVGPVAGCVSGALEREESGPTGTTTDSTSSPETATARHSTTASGQGAGSTTASGESTDRADSDEPTTHPTGADRSLPERSVEFPEGPKSPPERPADLTAERVREFVKTYEYRFVYNRLYRDETTEVHEECGVDSVTRYGDGFRVVVWCSAWANYEEDGSTVHADYFTQYATYYVGPDSTVRRDGKPGTRT